MWTRAANSPPQLRRLYDYFDRVLLEANLRKGPHRPRRSHPTPHRAPRCVGHHADAAGPDDGHPDINGAIGCGLTLEQNDPAMIAKNNLVEAYHSWEQLTQAEDTAIQSDDWPRVSRYQQSKQGLQRQIIHLTEAAQAECIEAGHDFKNLRARHAPDHQWLDRARESERQLISTRRASAEIVMADLDQAAHNLRRVQKSYSAPPDALWNSYS